MKVLERDSDNGYIGGVCSGLAAYTNTSPLAWRIIFLLASSSLIVYLVLWLLIKNK